MQKIIFYIKAFFLIIHYLLKKGYEPDWLYDEEKVEKAATDHETEYCVVTGEGVEAFAKLLVKDIQLYLYLKEEFKFEYTLTWYYKNYFYDNYKEQKMLNRKH